MNAAAIVIALTQLGAGVRRDAVPALDAPGEWMKVIELAVGHRVCPLIQYALTTTPAVAAPEAIEAQLDMEVWRCNAASMLCEDTLWSLLKLLTAQGIEVLVLKGAALAHDLYPMPELRSYHDIDILCRPADFPRLAAALLAAGYHAEEPSTPQEPSEWYNGSRRRSFTAPAGDVEIEVHLDVLGLGLKERHQDDFWRGARLIPGAPVPLRTLAPMHQLLHLAVHVHVHCYSRLLWLNDIDLLVRRYGDSLDWAQTMRLARHEGVGAVLRYVLATAHAVLGTPQPRLPRPTLEERLLCLSYRLLWPPAHVRRLERKQHLRLLRFHPGTGDPRDVFYGLFLLGRRREKWQAIRRHGYHLPRLTVR